MANSKKNDDSISVEVVDLNGQPIEQLQLSDYLIDLLAKVFYENMK